MTAPKPGDRVRVTFESTVTSGSQPGTCYVRYPSGGPVVEMGEVQSFRVPVEVVEVLASPVYVNSDTTEYRSGDVVRVDKPSGTGIIRPGECFVRQDDHWSRLGDACYYHDDHVSTSVQVRLLVRDGKPVTP